MNSSEHFPYIDMRKNDHSALRPYFHPIKIIRVIYVQGSTKGNLYQI